MKFSFLIFLIFLFLNNKAQFLLGLTKVETRKAINSTGQHKIFEKIHEEDSLVSLNWVEKDIVKSVYFFNDADISIIYTIAVPEYALNTFIESLNKKYVKISATTWNVYAEEKIFKIELVYLGKETFTSHMFNYPEFPINQYIIMNKLITITEYPSNEKKSIVADDIDEVKRGGVLEKDNITTTGITIIKFKDGTTISVGESPDYINDLWKKD